MRKWIILALDHGDNEGQMWRSREYTLLDDALLEAAWLQQRDWLFGFDGVFTVVEVTL